jgi:hypothetical protein
VVASTATALMTRKTCVDPATGRISPMRLGDHP